MIFFLKEDIFVLSIWFFKVKLNDLYFIYFKEKKDIWCIGDLEFYCEIYIWNMCLFNSVIYILFIYVLLNNCNI